MAMELVWEAAIGLVKGEAVSIYKRKIMVKNLENG
jgi:hypothetical protein